MTASFLYLLIVVLAAAGAHLARLRAPTVPRAAEVVLLYILVGYCGVPMLAVGTWSLFRPDRVAAILGFPAGNPFQTFLSYALLGMALVAVLAVRYRGAYLVAPALLWAVFFAGATAVHLGDIRAHDHLSHRVLLHVFATHALISILLLTALGLSGEVRRQDGEARPGSLP